MHRLTFLVMAGAIALASAACGQPAGSLQASVDALGAANLKSIEYSGTGRWFQFGQAPSPTLAWPQFDVSSFTAVVNYDAPSARVEMARKQTIEPGRSRPAPVEQRAVQMISGTYAWNLAAPGGAQPGSSPVPQAQPGAASPAR